MSIRSKMDPFQQQSTSSSGQFSGPQGHFNPNSAEWPSRKDFPANLHPTNPLLRKTFSFDSPRVKALKNASTEEFLSPSKEGEVPMDYSPCAKSPAVAVFNSFHLANGNNSSTTETNRHQQPTAGFDPISQSQTFSSSSMQPNYLPSSSNQSMEEHDTCATFAGAKSDPLPLLSDSDSESPSNTSEMQPDYIFKTSPGSPSRSDPNSEDMFERLPSLPKEESTAEKIQRLGIRRWRSHEMRKHFSDMSNTPPSAFSSRRTLFKRPVGVVEEPETPVKRPREKDGMTRRPSQLACVEVCASGEPSQSDSDLSDNHERIKSAVDALQCTDLVADGSRPYFLPVVEGKHSDLKNIDAGTMADLLRGRFAGSFDKLTVIDCRYPYEYNGGHIQGAINIYTEPDMSNFLSYEAQASETGSRKHVLVFHCEFSSQRGPNLLRHLRKTDRVSNMDCYPALNFPEIYCLCGGYKEFFAAYPELCEPRGYITMNDQLYANQLRHFRGKARSWAAGERHKRK